MADGHPMPDEAQKRRARGPVDPARDRCRRPGGEKDDGRPPFAAMPSPCAVRGARTAQAAQARP